MSQRHATIGDMDHMDDLREYIDSRFFEEEFLAAQTHHVTGWAAGPAEAAGATTDGAFVRPSGETANQAPAGAIG